MLKGIKKLLEHNALAIAIFLTLFIALISLVSLKGFISGIDISHSDKYGHFIAYLVLSLSWLVVFKNKKHTILVIVALIAYGIIIEVLQGITKYRQPDIYDIIANSIGVLLAAFVFRVYRRTKGGY